MTGEVADPCKTRKNACPASALFQCSLIRSDAADHKATPPPPIKNVRCAAAGHKTNQRRRRPSSAHSSSVLVGTGTQEGLELYLKTESDGTDMTCFMTEYFKSPEKYQTNFSTEELS